LIFVEERRGEERPATLVKENELGEGSQAL
jgi:hypothetical protein